jgi:nucleoside-diphosphate-sugar epimerase
MKRDLKSYRILVTGGAGFLGSHDAGLTATVDRYLPA